jgi:prepilin-type N-terminal cleavage/methylation domain-containing protein
MRRPSRGFTLIELSIVIAILSLMIVGIMAAVTQESRRGKQADLKTKMDTIEESLMNFVKLNYRLPCPADGQVAINLPAFGAENGSPGICTPITGGYTDGSHTIGGVIPTKALGLPDEAMFDPWGGRFTYAVDIRATGNLTGAPTDGEPKGVLNSRLPPGTSGTYYPTNSTAIGSITVKDEWQANTRISNALAVVISHGPNGHGAYQLNGARKSSGSNNLDELKNCHCTSATPPVNAAVLDATFVQSPSNNYFNQSADVTYFFDDTVRYYVRSSFLKSTDQLVDKP